MKSCPVSDRDAVGGEACWQSIPGLSGVGTVDEDGRGPDATRLCALALSSRAIRCHQVPGSCRQCPGHDIGVFARRWRTPRPSSNGQFGARGRGSSVNARKSTLNGRSAGRGRGLSTPTRVGRSCTGRAVIARRSEARRNRRNRRNRRTRATGATGATGARAQPAQPRNRRDRAPGAPAHQAPLAGGQVASIACSSVTASLGRASDSMAQTR